MWFLNMSNTVEISLLSKTSVTLSFVSKIKSIAVTDVVSLMCHWMCH